MEDKVTRDHKTLAWNHLNDAEFSIMKALKDARIMLSNETVSKLEATLSAITNTKKTLL